MTVRFVAEAREELLDAIRYYEGAESGLGRRFRCEFEAAVRHLREHPEIYRLRDTAHRRINLKTFPFFVPFIIRGDTVWVLAVAHESRRPRYWIARRPPEST